MPAHGGIRSDSITIAHDLIVGSPVPTDHAGQLYASWPYPVRHPGQYEYTLSDYPPSILPSGGSSNVISVSEMLFAGIRFSTMPDAPIVMTWHRLDPNQDVPIFRTTAVYSYVGHYPWEVAHPGSYYLTIETQWGTLTIDWVVTGPPCSTTFC